MCTHLWAPVLGGAFVEPIRWIREQQGPLSHLPAALQPVLRDRRAAQPGFPPKNHNLLVFSSVLVQGRERNELTKSWPHVGMWGSPPLRDTVTPLGTEAPQPGTASAGDGNIWSKRARVGEGWCLQQGPEGLGLIDCTQTGKLCSAPRSLCRPKEIVWSCHRIS